MTEIPLTIKEVRALSDIKCGDLVSISRPEVAYETCRNQQKEFGNYDRCDRCQFRFKCWTAGEPTGIVYSAEELTKATKRAGVTTRQLAEAFEKVFKRVIDEELLNIYDGAK